MTFAPYFRPWLFPLLVVSANVLKADAQPNFVAIIADDLG